MSLKVEDLGDERKYRLFLTVPYDNLVDFILEYLRKGSRLLSVYGFLCLIFLLTALYVRINISGYFAHSRIFLHTIAGMIIYPVICIPIHESLHILPYFLSGARNIRLGWYPRQFLFYVTAHRYVASARQFRIVAVFPFIIISFISVLLILILPGLWKWSFSLFLFVHATMCAGDFALLNLYYLNRNKVIYTWDDADKHEAYYYEEL